MPDLTKNDGSGRVGSGRVGSGRVGMVLNRAEWDCPGRLRSDAGMERWMSERDHAAQGMNE